MSKFKTRLDGWAEWQLIALMASTPLLSVLIALLTLVWPYWPVSALAFLAYVTLWMAMVRAGFALQRVRLAKRVVVEPQA